MTSLKFFVSTNALHAIAWDDFFLSLIRRRTHNFWSEASVRCWLWTVRAALFHFLEYTHSRCVLQCFHVYSLPAFAYDSKIRCKVACQILSVFRDYLCVSALINILWRDWGRGLSRRVISSSKLSQVQISVGPVKFDKRYYHFFDLAIHKIYIRPCSYMVCRWGCYDCL